MSSDKWIACSERLPDRNHSGDYIIAYTDANSEEVIVDRGYWRGDFWPYKVLVGDQLEVIVASQLIPEPKKDTPA